MSEINGEENKSKLKKFALTSLPFVLLLGFGYFMNAYNDTTAASFVNENPDKITGAFGITFMIFFWFYLVKEIRFFIKTKYWKKSKAVIIESRIIIDEDKNFAPFVQYSYTVDRKEYTSEKIYPNAGFSSSVQYFSRRMVRRFKKKSTVVFWYNPENPAESYLIRKGWMYICIFSFTATALLIISILMTSGIIDRHLHLLK
jgi:hypothetical protein